MRIVDSADATFPSPEVWDALVARDPGGHLLQTWAWGEFKAAFGWQALRVAIADGGELLAGAQVLLRRLGPLAIGYIPKGPAFAGGDLTHWESLMQAIHQRLRRRGAILLKLEPEWHDQHTDYHHRLLQAGFRRGFETIQPRRTVMVDLRGSEDDILARMKPKWRYNIRLSARKGIQVYEGTEADLPTFDALMRLTGERDAFGVHSAAYYAEAYRRFAAHDRVRLFMARYEDTPVAGLMVFAFNGQAWYMYGASSNEHRERMPNHQLQWRAMLWAREKGCHQYDLWGITDVDTDPDSQALSGVERFKLGFGGQVVDYVGAYDYVYSRPLYAALQAVWRWRKRRAQTTPNSA